MADPSSGPSGKIELQMLRRVLNLTCGNILVSSSQEMKKEKR